MRTHSLAVLLAAVMCGCSGGGASVVDAGVSAPPPSTPAEHSCSGALPANAALCPGADQGLTTDAPRVVTASACAAAPCSYACEAGYVAVEVTCACDAGPAVEVICQRPVVATPAARFTANGDGTVTDERTGLVWLQAADCTDSIAGVSREGGGVAFYDAVTWVHGLASGSCGLSDGSAAGTWSLPIREQLLDFAADLGSTATASAFTYGPDTAYWSTYQDCITNAFAARLPAPGSSAPVGGSTDLVQYPVDTPLGAWPFRSPSP